MDALAGVTRKEGHTEFLRLPSAVLALIFLARRVQPSLSLVDREVEFVYPRINRSPLGPVPADNSTVNTIGKQMRVRPIN